MAVDALGQGSGSGCCLTLLYSYAFLFVVVISTGVHGEMGVTMTPSGA